jgi:sugar phosphate isomerase/epimerase
MEATKRRIGFSSHCFSRAIPIEEVIELGLSHRFNAMELNVDATTFNPDVVKPSTVDWVAGISRSGEVRFSMHAPEDVNFAAPDSDGRKVAVQETEKAIRLAARLAIDTVVTHPGKVVGVDGQTRADGRQQTIEGIARCAQTARDLGVRLSVENLCHVTGTVAPSVASFLTMCEQIGLSLVAMTLDTGHTFVDGLVQTVNVMRPYINHVHIDDNSGAKSEHLELGRGALDFPAIAEFLRSFTGNINIELKRTGKENSMEQDAGPVLRSREYLRRLLDGSPRGIDG